MLTPFQKAALKLAWTKCKNVGSHSTPTATIVSADSSSSTAAASWSESFAPKLTSAVVAKLKAQFKVDYPAEILTAENMPSLRLLSLVHHQHSKQDHKWVPWKFRLSHARAEDISASAGSLEVIEGSQRFAICMGFQTGKCSLGDQCKFRHVCAFPTKKKGRLVDAITVHFSARPRHTDRRKRTTFHRHVL